MSMTRIYRLGRDPGQIGATSNAWRGAMYVWNEIAKRYFGLSGFPMLDKEMSQKIWNAYRHVEMPEHEVIVLMTTMDNAVVYGRDVEKVCAAFDKYAETHPNSSLKDQAHVLRASDIQPDDLIAWQQTSVSEFWGEGDSDEEAGEPTWYDPATGDKHFDAYAAAVER